jgi:hypothetical protein
MAEWGRLWMTSRTSESLKALRVTIGLLGIGLAPAVWLLARTCGDVSLLPSVSDYYHTNSRDVFVGVLGLLGTFQISYRGYRLADDLCTWATGLLALGIAFFPCSSARVSLVCPPERTGIFQLPQATSGIIHATVACLFFLLVAIYVLVFFRMGNGHPTRQKIRKNRIFTVCGYGMLAVLALMFMAFLIWGASPFLRPGRLFAPEALLLLLFGVAWLVKANVVPGLIDP